MAGPGFIEDRRHDLYFQVSLNFYGQVTII
jgi:hypothetical protein